jgi:hypothetical protein
MRAVSTTPKADGDRKPAVPLRQNGKTWSQPNKHIAPVTISTMHVSMQRSIYPTIYYLLSKYRPYIMSPLLIKSYHQVFEERQKTEAEIFLC